MADLSVIPARLVSSRRSPLRYAGPTGIVRFTWHAIRRAEQRGIDMEEIARRVLALPASLRDIGRRKRKYLHGDDGLVAIARPSSTGWTVVSLWREPRRNP